MASSSSKPASGSASEPQIDAELEKILAREATSFQRDIEVERILKAFKLNPYDILDVDETATPEEIKRKYRQLSLIVHPDKATHARAPEAFDMLKKADTDLAEPLRRTDLDATISQARITLLKELGLDTKKEDLVLPKNFKQLLRAKSRDMLIEEELRRRKAIKLTMANEGNEARQKEEEVNAKKRKAENDKAWEERREDRVSDWRTFAKKEKKKKVKIQILG